MFRRSLLALGLLATAGLLVAFTAQAAGARPAHVPKTIIIGFDGMDHALTSRFMEQGQLPNLARLAQMGLFQRLETSNPAQSPVSWAVLNTGCNPGKTGVAGFMSRTFTKPDKAHPEWLPVPIPQIMLGFNTMIPADDFVRLPVALRWPLLFTGVAAGLGFALVLGLLRLARFGWVASSLLALLGGAAGAWWAHGYVDGLPADGQLPYVVNPVQATSFWSWLDERGVRLRGIQIASTYPPDNEGPNTELLSGLGVFDVTGSPGAWYVYTNDSTVFADKSTATSGKIIKLYEDQPGRMDAQLFGPRNWVQEAAMNQRIADLKAALEGEGDRSSLRDELEQATSDRKQWGSGGRTNDRTTIPFAIRPDEPGNAVDIFLGAAPGTPLDPLGPGVRQLRLQQGQWSDMLPVEFVLNERYSAHGLVTFHLIRCDAEGTRVFVPPINIDPQYPPEQTPISAPPGFAAELEHEIGKPYETLGWACITNPLKDTEDSHVSEQAFMDDMVSTEALREELLMASLDRAQDWDVYFQVLSTPDRVGHLLFRESDPGHPAYDAALADTQVTAWGETFPLKDALLHCYRNEDRIIGRILDRLEKGDLGEDCLLLVVSDHGFSTFRRQVNLNNALYDLGFLKFKGDQDLAAVMQLIPKQRDLLMQVDWSRTRAYSMGLGEVFVNLVGREPQGIVRSEQYDAFVEQLRTALLALRDPKDGAQVVTSVSRRDELYSGPWWKEGTATRMERGVPVEVHHDGFADLFLGYAPGYRVSWGNTMGGLDAAAITDNENHWSGDHVSVDPAHVPGILFSNRKLQQPTEAHLQDIAPTMLVRYGIDPAPPNTEMDGHPLPFENVTR
ncbi:MAG TPA: alkaline phosphatase family protein [Candidatus Limnocylindrales bacterium]|nr:alkaline phosphatase family protein [Candidatus Limnocylindrales bacterium]